MWAIVRTSEDEDENPKPLTPEELKIRESIDNFDGWLILVLGVLIFGALIWALIVS